MTAVQRRCAIILLWIGFIFFVANILEWTQSQKIEPELVQQEFSIEQQTLYEKYISTKRVGIPTKLTIQETGDTIYQYPDGSFNTTPPEWYKDGVILLSPEEEEETAGLVKINTPYWIFWETEMSVGEYNTILDVLYSVIAFGIIFGLFFCPVEYDLRYELTTGLISGLVAGLISGLVAGPIIGLMAGLMAGLMTGLATMIITILVAVSGKFWTLPPSKNPPEISN